MSRSYWDYAGKVNKALGEYDSWKNIAPIHVFFQEGQRSVYEHISEMTCMCLELWFSTPTLKRWLVGSK